MSLVAHEPVLENCVHVTDVRPAPSRPTSKKTATLRCLIVSEDESHLELLSGAAADSGFEPIVCSDASKGWLMCRRDELYLAFLDLASISNKSSAKEFGEHLSRDRKMLVAVCGDETEPGQEIWARQIGAWLYLPGLGEREGLAAVCSEARPVVERMISR